MTEPQKQTERASYALFAFAVFCAFGASVYSAVSHRPMFLDGSYWYFNVLQHHEPFYDRGYLRLFGTVLQLPAVLLLKLLGKNATEGAVALLDFAYALHPWLSLGLTYCILRSRGKRELFFFAMLSYATATQSAIAFGVGVVPDALSVFWPLFALVVTRSQNSSWVELSTIAFASIALALTYEASILFFALLTSIVFLDRESGSRPRKVLIVLFVLCALWLAYRLWGPTAGSKQHFFFSIRQKLGLFRGLCLMTLTGLAAAFWFKSRKILYGTAVAIFLFAWFGVSARVFDLFVSFNARTTAIPLAAFIGALAYVMREKMSRLPKHDLSVFLGIALLVSAAHDLTNTIAWRKRVAPVYSLLDKYDGCVYMPESAPHLGNDWALPYLSTLLQKRAEISTVVFARLEDVFPEKGPCDHFMDGYIVDLHNRLQIEPPKHFEFIKALSGRIASPTRKDL